MYSIQFNVVKAFLGRFQLDSHGVLNTIQCGKSFSGRFPLDSHGVLNAIQCGKSLWSRFPLGSHCVFDITLCGKVCKYDSRCTDIVYMVVNATLKPINNCRHVPHFQLFREEGCAPINRLTLHILVARSRFTTSNVVIVFCDQQWQVIVRFGGIVVHLCFKFSFQNFRISSWRPSLSSQRQGNPIHLPWNRQYYSVLIAWRPLSFPHKEVIFLSASRGTVNNTH